MDYRHAVVVIVFFTTCSAVSVTDYFQKIGRYFGYNSDNQVEVGSTYNNRIPYEVTTEDEKFIAEAAKLTGVALSELDSCQHRVSCLLYFVYAGNIHAFYCCLGCAKVTN